MFLDAHKKATPSEKPRSDLEIPRIGISTPVDDHTVVSQNSLQLSQDRLRLAPTLAPEPVAPRARQRRREFRMEPPGGESRTQAAGQSGQGLEQTQSDGQSMPAEAPQSGTRFCRE